LGFSFWWYYRPLCECCTTNSVSTAFNYTLEYDDRLFRNSHIVEQWGWVRLQTNPNPKPFSKSASSNENEMNKDCSGTLGISLASYLWQ